MNEICKNWSTWLKKTRFSYMDENQKEQTLNWLIAVRNSVLNLADLKEGLKIADFGCGSGLLAFGVLEKFEDKVELIFSDKFQDCLDECKKILNETKIKNNAKFLKTDASNIKLKNNYLDRLMTRSVLVHIKDKKQVFSEFYRVLKQKGIYAGFEPIISENTRYYELLTPNQISDYEEFKQAEKEFMKNPDDALVNFNAESLDKNLLEVNFSNVTINVEIASSKYIPTKETIINWLQTPPAPDQKSMKERFLEYFDEKKVNNYIIEVQNALNNNMVEINSKTAFIKAIK